MYGGPHRISIDFYRHVNLAWRETPRGDPAHPVPHMREKNNIKQHKEQTQVSHKDVDFSVFNIFEALSFWL